MKVTTEFTYFVHLIQNLWNRPLPPCLRVVDNGTSRHLEIDWEAAISELWPTAATMPHEGHLLVLQVILLDPLRWDSHMPLLHERLVPYRSWVFPYPPSLEATHLNRDKLPGDLSKDVQRFHVIRQQIFRYLGQRSAEFSMALRASFESLMEPVLAVRRRGLSELVTHLNTLALSDAQGFHETPPYLVGPVDTGFKTTIGQELAALLRGERFGAVKDKNYLFVRHMGLASHLEALGDLTPFHSAQVLLCQDYSTRVALLAESIRRFLKERFRQASDVTAIRVMRGHPQLKNVLFAQGEWSVVLRSDVSASLREFGETARRRRERTVLPKAPRKIRVAAFAVPSHLHHFAEVMHVLWRKGDPYIDVDDLKMVPKPVSVAGLTREEYVAYDTKGLVTHDLTNAAKVFYHRQALSHLGMDVFSKWISVEVPTRERWLRQLTPTPGRVMYYGRFTREQDHELLSLWKKYQKKSVWEAFEARTHHPAKEAKRRARFVSFAVRGKNLTVNELHDLNLVEQRIGPRAWKQWHVIAKRACP